jgi:acyl carrier protein|tara:strand:- start:979 stop:1251 length:273 start_codon:yes stop_codon:yes gene_type:complete
MNITIKEIETDLIQYLKSGNPLMAKLNEIPKNDSLVELGYMDSFGIIDLVTYFEKQWKIKIENEEITVEHFGSINKMTKLINQKISIKYQ